MSNTFYFFPGLILFGYLTKKSFGGILLIAIFTQGPEGPFLASQGAGVLEKAVLELHWHPVTHYLYLGA